MLRHLFRFCLILAIIALIVIVENSTRYLLPFPWNSINAPVFVLSLVFIWRETGGIVWIAFFAYSILEIFAATPYGFGIFAGTMAWLFGFWLYEYVFTNQTWYTVAALSAATAIIYRVMFLGTVRLGDFFSSEMFLTPRVTIGSVAWEIVMTSIVTTIAYIVATWILRRKNRTKKLYWT